MYKLVIADDDTLILRKFVSLFDWEAMGFTIVSSFSSSTECLNYLRQNRIDALLTDIRMPNLSGLELIKICSDEFPYMGIVITSAYTNFEYAHRAIKYNVIDYVLKPIDDNDLSRAMERLKDYLDRTHSRNDADMQTDSVSKKIENYISQNYHQNISSIDMARHLMISPDYFSFYFKKHTGQNFSCYLRNFRLKKACQLLKDSDLKIPVIVEKVGYKSLTHFYESFSEQYAMTPTEYRKQNNND